MMFTAGKGLTFFMLLAIHVLHRCVADLPAQLRSVRPDGVEEESTAVAHFNSFYKKILPDNSPLQPPENLPSAAKKTIEAETVQSTSHFPNPLLSALEFSRGQPKKSKHRLKFDKNSRLALELQVEQRSTRDDSEAITISEPETSLHTLLSSSTDSNLVNNYNKEKETVHTKKFVRDVTKTWNGKEKDLHIPVTNSENRTTGRPERKKFKSRMSHASSISDNFEKTISVKRRTLSKLLPENLDTLDALNKAPDLKARSFLNTTSSSGGKEIRTTWTGNFLNTKTLRNSVERGIIRSITRRDDLVRDVMLPIPAHNKISEPQILIENPGLNITSSVKRDFPKPEFDVITGAVESADITPQNGPKKSSKRKHQPDIKEPQREAPCRSLLDEIQLENTNYQSDDIHINEHRPTVENYIIDFDEDGDARAKPGQPEDAPQEEDTETEDSADILVPDGDIADSEALRELQYSKHSVETMRARLLAIMDLHKRLCEHAALQDPPDWQGCKRAWDQVLCWPPARPASLSSLPCPGHVPGMDARERDATRWCDETGKWEESPHTKNLGTSTSKPQSFRRETNLARLSDFKSSSISHESTTSNHLHKISSPHPNNPERVAFVTTRPMASGNLLSTRTTQSLGTMSLESTIPPSFNDGWTNYTACLAKPRKPARKVSPLIAKWLPLVSSISLVGYSISLTSLVFSCAILASFKRLRCARNLLHLHLFASFSLRALAVLLKTTLISPVSVAAASTYDLNEEISSSGWVCRVKVAVWEYFIIANYSWLLMEGLYLHNLIFRALFTDSSALMPYILLGWGMPLIVIVCWSVARVLVDNSHCWLVHFSPWPHWIGLRLPVAVSVFLNLFFFVNIIRVLASKLRSSVSRDNRKYKKLSRSTLVLVPLFGIHYCLLWGLSLSSHPPVELTWLLLDQVCSSFQGLIVSVLYCFMNGEVKQELKKVYGRATHEEDLGPMGTSYSTVMSRAKASQISMHGSSERALPSSSPGTAPHTPPLLSKNHSVDFFSLGSVPEERVEMQLYDSSEPRSTNFMRLSSLSSMDRSCENDDREIDAVLNENEMRNDFILTEGEKSSKKKHLISATFIPASSNHVNKISNTKSYCRSSLDRGHIPSKSCAQKKKAPLVKKLSFQEPVKGLPFLGEILNSENTNKRNLSGSSNSGMNSNAEETTELSSLLSVHNSMSSATFNNSSLAEDDQLSKSIDPLCVTQNNSLLIAEKCNGISTQSHSEKLINS